jgi:hypothetical protein
MFARSRHWLVLAGLVLALGGTATPALASAVVTPDPVGPDQSFFALVNGQRDIARITVGCVGSTGHPLPGQTVEVVHLSGEPGPTDGFTGTAAKAIDVGLDSASTVPLQLRFYHVIVEIPTSTVVPCGGLGTVSFVPDPTSASARPAVVKVVFVGQS